MDSAESLSAAVVQEYETATGLKPDLFVTTATAGTDFNYGQPSMKNR
jgi:hypothetical protein